MLRQLLRRWEAFPAKFTPVRLFLGVDQIMSLQPRQFEETLPAHIALVRPLASMGQNVDLQIKGAGVGFSARVAFVQFFPAVRQVVALERGQLGEASFAYFALVRHLSCVDHRVLF